MLPILRPHNRNLTHTQRLDRLRPPPRTNQSNLRKIHVYPPTGLADELHVMQHWAIVAVLQVRPYSTLGLADFVEVEGGRCLDGSAGDAGYEPCAEEDGQDSEVLGVVVYGYLVVSGAKRILYPSAEIMRERHLPWRTSFEARERDLIYIPA